LFFFAVRFFKRRKAGALIAGIVVCLLIYVLATVFNISSIRYILSGVFEIGVLVLVVLFQPEIREALEKMGSGSLKSIKILGDNSSKNQSQYKVIDNICKAVQILSIEKTGALIVIERTTQLDDILHSGTVINSDVSESLIRNIFFNRAPLHDGAIVIDEGKIVAAACILPLPKRTTVDSELGTRHRAAVGISEVSDAITIVVSEETGVISVAKECKLIRDFTCDDLRKYLYHEIINESGDENTN
jgi:diadenylate cyclase